MSQQNKTPADPLIDEIRAIRKELSERFDNDVYKLGRHLQELERRQAARVVLPPAAATNGSQQAR